MSKYKLKKCPCGEIPEKLIIEQKGIQKWARVYGSCCNEWMIEFRCNYNDAQSKKAYELAVEAWNTAPRAKGEE